MPKKKSKEKIKINRIKLVLVEKEISQKELARRVNVSTNSMARICNNAGQPRLTLLREIALALDVDITELLVHTKN